MSKSGEPLPPISPTPQVLVTLRSDGGLQMEFPWSGGRRQVEMRNGEAEEDLLRVLHAQLQKRIALGEDGSPTQAQLKHWEQHGMFGNERCAFCRAEGRFDKRGRERRNQPREIVVHGDVVVRRVAPKGRGSEKRSESGKTAEELGL